MEDSLNEKPPLFTTVNYGRQLIFLLSVTLLLMISGSLLFGYIGISFDCWESVCFLRIAQFFNTVLTFLIPALLFSKWMTNNFLQYSHADKMPRNKMLFIVLGLSITLLPVTIVLGYINEMMHLPEIFAELETWMREMEERARETILLMTEIKTIPILLLNFLLMAVTPAICEEFFFRGTLQPLLQKWSKSSHLSIWITAFVFSAIHLQFYGFLPRFLLGAYLGYLAVWSGSIRLPIFAHFLYNGITILIDFFSEKSQNLETVEGETSEMLTILLPVAAVASVAVFFGLRSLYKMRNDKS